MKPVFNQEDMERAYFYGKNNATEREFRLMMLEVVHERVDSNKR